jgi:hypothetical protein
MIDEILDSTKSSLADRISSPLLGSFLVSWCIWNWKFLVILFSDAGVTQTFSLVESVAFSDINDILSNGLLYPLITSLIYVFIYPFPARYVYGFMLYQKNKNNRLRQSVANETPLTLEESRQLTAEFNEIYQKQILQIEELNEKISQLTLASQDKNSKELKNSKLYNYSKNEITESQIFLLQLIADQVGGASENGIKKIAGINTLQIVFDIEELVRKSLLERVVSIRGEGNRLRLTHEGVGVLLQKNRNSSDEASPS